MVRLRVAALDLDEIVINFSVYRKMLFGQFTETSSPFSGIGSLTRIPFKITIGPNCRSLEGLFYGCANLVELPCMDTSGITCFNAICYECVSLTGVPQLDTSRVESFQNAFHGCRSLHAAGDTLEGAFDDMVAVPAGQLLRKTHRTSRF